MAIQPTKEVTLKTIITTVPAAGADLVQTVPAGKIWILQGITAKLVTSAQVANRTTNFTFDDGTNVFMTLTSRTVQTATQTVTQNAAKFATLPTDVAATTFYYALPQELELGAGYNIKSVTTNIQTSDQYSAIFLIVKEFSAQ